MHFVLESASIGVWSWIFGFFGRINWHIRVFNNPHYVKFQMKRKKTAVVLNPLTGTWKCGDGFSDVEISVEFKGDTPSVSVIDKYDDEVPQIFDVLWDAEKTILSFGTLCSTGRFVKYSFMSSPIDGRAGVTFSYTDQELWIRQ